ncbi:MAG: VOC family protein [Rhodobacteraceae bacterium]|nr:VOC family protein [Paracoccaceae bacterium]
MTQHIGAVALVVPDYDAAIAFYCDTLGFSLTADEDQGGGKRWVLVTPPGASETRLLLAQAKGADQEAAIGNQIGGRVFLFLHTDDFDADHARMQAAGVTFEEAPRTEPYGKVAVFCDPFVNRWDLLQLF